jgi:hypothetical protein
MPTRTLDLKFKGKRPIKQPRTRWFNQVLEDIKEREELARNQSGKIMGQ